MQIFIYWRERDKILLGIGEKAEEIIAWKFINIYAPYMNDVRLQHFIKVV